jgi:hypothetical protein
LKNSAVGKSNKLLYFTFFSLFCNPYCANTGLRFHVTNPISPLRTSRILTNTRFVITTASIKISFIHESLNWSIQTNASSPVRQHAHLWHASLYLHVNATYGLFVCIKFCESFDCLSSAKPHYLGTFLLVKFVLITCHACKELQLWLSTCYRTARRWTHTFLQKNCFWKVSPVSKCANVTDSVVTTYKTNSRHFITIRRFGDIAQNTTRSALTEVSASIARL